MFYGCETKYIHFYLSARILKKKKVFKLNSSDYNKFLTHRCVVTLLVRLKAVANKITHANDKSSLLAKVKGSGMNFNEVIFSCII